MITYITLELFYGLYSSVLSVRKQIIACSNKVQLTSIFRIMTY